MQFKQWKNSTLLSLITGVLGKRWSWGLREGGGGRDLNKWNWGNDIYAMELIPLKSYKESFVFL